MWFVVKSDFRRAGAMLMITSREHRSAIDAVAGALWSEASTKPHQSAAEFRRLSPSMYV